jgi:hypothetical protein
MTRLQRVGVGEGKEEKHEEVVKGGKYKKIKSE